MDTPMLMKVAKSGKYGLTVERSPSVETPGHYSEHEFIDEEVIDNSHLMVENLFGSPVVTVIRKASPYKEKLDKLISLLLDGGMFKIWEARAAHSFLSPRRQLAMELSRSSSRKSAPKKLSVSHIQGTFIIYGCGIIISFIAFICEYFDGKNVKQKH